MPEFYRSSCLGFRVECIGQNGALWRVSTNQSLSQEDVDLGAQRAQYSLIKEYTLNDRGIHIMI